MGEKQLRLMHDPKWRNSPQGLLVDLANTVLSHDSYLEAVRIQLIPKALPARVVMGWLE